jgi:predicted ATPase
MIQRLETLYYQCLRHVDRHLTSCQVLVGPNASGKTTFLDAIAFLGDLVRDGLDAAIHNRTVHVQDLIWHHKADRFELAIELPVPEPEGNLFSDHAYTRCRYEIAIGLLDETGEPAILAEKVLMLTEGVRDEQGGVQESLFPIDGPAPNTLSSPRLRGVKTIIHKISGGNDKFYDETGAGWDPSFKLGPRRSALSNLPEDESRFPVATYLKRTLSFGLQRLTLNSANLRRPSPPGQIRQLRADGANLPWIIAALEEKNPAAHLAWINHLRQVLPNLETIRTLMRPEDRHRYLMVKYQNGLEIPSWMLSEGTLRLFAFTLLAHLPDFAGIYLIEEPENGLHPGAVETAFRALNAIPKAQILMTTHSPIILNIVDPDYLLCFTTTDTGATKIISGAEHPGLSNWQTHTDLSTFFGAGMLR